MLKVMIMEDEPLIALNLKKLLEKKGFEVTGHAGNTEEVHTLFYANKPDIILSDIKLENDESGIDIIKELKKRDHFCVIYLTSYGDDAMIEKALESNPAAYITKPFKEIDLNAALKLVSITIKSKNINPDFYYNKETRALFYKNEQIILTKQESDLFHICYLSYGDKLGINGVISTETDLKNGKFYYNFPLMANGLRGELSASRTSYSLAEEYKALDALGHSTTLEASLSYPLIRTRLESLHLHLGYAHKKMRDEIKSIDDVTKKDSDALSLGANYLKHHTLFTLNSTLSSELKLTKGVLDSPSNADTDGAYAKVSGSVEETMTFSPQHALTTSLRFQHALNNKNLDGSEDFSLGGAYGVRAFPDGEHSAENGYILGAELFYTLPSYESINHKASFFVDTGYASMQNKNGTSESRQLSDIGLGYQASYKQFFTKVQIARVMGGEKVESESERSTKLLLQLGFVY